MFHSKTKINTLFIFSIALLAPLFSIAQGAGSWIQKSSLPAGSRAAAFSFSIGKKGYVGGGLNFTTGPFQDFWEYNSGNNTWTQKANFGGGKRSAAVAFSIGGKGYAMTGSSATAKKNDIWQYDTLTNLWLQMTNLPATERNYSVAFSIGDYGYLGTGYTSTGFVSLNDFWQFDPASNTWTQKANVPGPQRSSAIGFSIGDKGYIGTGDTCDNSNCFILNDFYEYDPITNIWTMKANAGISLRHDATAFVINGRGYICTGVVNFSNTNDLIEYNPATNTWTTRASKPGIAKSNAFGFSAGNHGYVGTGYDPEFNTTTDMYEYTPDTSDATTVNEISNAINISVFPNPIYNEGNITVTSANQTDNETLELYYSTGKQVSSFTSSREAKSGNEFIFHFTIGTLSPGIYFYLIRSNEQIIASGKLVVM